SEKNDSYSPSLQQRLGFEPDQRVAIFHADDVGMCHGANAAFEELSKDGSINCGAVMVPCPWFSEVVAMAAANPDIDLGVHLALTSEWKSYRWAPISTTRRNSGLIDADGYFWHRLPMLAVHVVPEAAEAEMRAQIERALSAGIDVTHIDMHMGVALLPQLVDIYIRLGREYRLPVLLPKHLSEYTSVLEFDNISLDEVTQGLGRLEADGWPLVDHFRMTPGVPARESDSAYRELIAGLPKGLTVVAVHPNISGDIEVIIPEKAHFRTEEYRLFRDAEFKEFIASQNIHAIGFRPIRNLLRQKE
ncbi:MAG: polysaccharide deacetylase family protein, partial [Planctomycetota bacterium]